MIQFNLNRFGKVARWSFINDKRYFVKSFLQAFVVLLVMFVLFTMVFPKDVAREGDYNMCAIAVFILFVVTTLFGPSFMFYSMEGKHDMQALLMLPASNFEKYLMRYASWILLQPLYLAAFLAADLLQYVAHLVMGYGDGRFVAAALAETWSILVEHQWMPKAVHVLIPIAVWLHSLYALGATFFRSRRFNWVLTSISLMLLSTLQVWLLPSVPYREATTSHFILNDVFCTFWIVLNFWLSYRLFCRRQVIGKFVNL